MTPTALLDLTNSSRLAPAQELAALSSMTSPPTPVLDTCIHLLYADETKPGGIKVENNADISEEFLYAHRSVLLKSPFFRAQLQQSASAGPITTFPVDLSSIKHPVESFKALLVFMYTGQLNATDALRDSLIHLSKLVDLPAVEQQLMAPNKEAVNTLLDLQRAAALISAPVRPVANSSPLASMSPPTSAMAAGAFAPPLHPALCAAYLQLLQQQQAQQQQQEQLQQQALLNNLIQASPHFGAAPSALLAPSSIFPKFEAANTTAEGFLSETRSVTSSCSSGNQAAVPSPPFDNLGDVLVPSNEKEGWCRNKKYIQTVPKGFKCTVCNKVYGRYNSVSYHVTIYHRNPPIRCEETGCQFTTREARYIHFHRYYRHQIPLPESIDLASRKCPFFSCRHVSKSPAMLEKHLSRHVADCTKDGQTYQCPNCEFSTDTHEACFLHLRAHQLGVEANEEAMNKTARPGPSHNVFGCDQCGYKGRTLSNLEQHKHSKHTTPFCPTSSGSSPEATERPEDAMLSAAQMNLVATLKSLPAFSGLQLFPPLSDCGEHCRPLILFSC
ncbi:Zinc finger protein [Aphelenchoides fujianensis]|nr:Zinc finger protein [Aphelenchoides fujianensis]